jgi:hypothetical protein
MIGRVLAFVALLTVGAFAQAPGPALPPLEQAKAEAHKLRVENAQLRAALSSLQAEIDALKLSAERAALEAQIREAVKPPAGSTFNWQTLTFDPLKEPK